MPSGYTSIVVDGDVTFKAFAERCVRAMGVFYHLRDSPMDTPLPDKAPLSLYHKEALVNAQLELSKLEEMNPAEQELEIQQDYDRAHTSWQESRARTEIVRARVERMLAEVEAWTPPTSEHVGLKAFMREQLQETLQYDGSGSSWPEPVRQTVEQWVEERRQRALRDIEYHSKKWALDQSNAEANTAWIRAFKASLR